MDKDFIARGVKRCSQGRFLLWIAPWAALLAFGLWSAGLCLVKGLNQTNMDNRFAFGLWIFLDLTVIALGAGAFFTGFLLYILKLDDLRAVINSAVVIGLVCYSGAVAALMRRYANVPMSLADAGLVRLSELVPGCVVFTLDGDFRIYRRHGRQKIPLVIPPEL